jgi:hypothetical protein
VSSSTIEGGAAGTGGASFVQTGGVGGDGGGIANTGGGSVTVTASTISDGQAGAGATSSYGGGGDGGSGGGIANTGGGTVTVTTATIAGGSAGAGAPGRTSGGPTNGGDGGSGGGIANTAGGTATIHASTISGGEIGQGGAGSPAVLGSKPAGSMGSPGSGGAVANTSVGTMSAGSSILSEEGVSATTDCAGKVTDTGYNVTDDSSCSFAGAGADIADPAIGLGALATNGGPVQTEAIGASSEAHDLVPAASCTATDARGVPRPQPAGGSACDAGAFEDAPPQITGPDGATPGGRST